ncbi:MAG: ABC transporter ATP-binding protein [Coriobacteriia bacterium]|nr:ABC transporter ATP-binding protein [Coriobacteriia bacterium]MCL2536999.1 ABC transporter ATP-binding protein [Coriobacteriia bacterium]
MAERTPRHPSLRPEDVSSSSRREQLRSSVETSPLLDLNAQEHARERAPENSKPIFEVRDLSFAYANQQVFEGLSFDIAEGKITALMGANGAGKSTLFKLLTKNLKPQGQAHIMLDGRDLNSYRLSELAKKLAVVWQNNIAPHDITVHDLVAYGRVPHKKAFQSMSHEDEAAIAEALKFCDLEGYEDRRMQELSGGQQQRVWIAMGLAQQTPIMFFDEPTSFLDVRYQVMVLRLIRRLNRELGLTVVVILHDINQSFELCDEVIALRPDGSLVKGSPQKLADEDFLRDIYEADLRVGMVGEQVVVHAPL